MMKFESEAFITRHSTRGEGSEYEQLSPEGVEKAKERVDELQALIESAEAGSVFVMGGNTSEARTRSTLQVYVDELKSRLEGQDDYLFLEREEIKNYATH